MKIKHIISVIVITFLCYNSKAQESAKQVKIQELKVGETVPDLLFNNLLNYKTQQAKLSDFKGKVVILDFWNTGCGPCIAAFPHLDSLQQKFKGQLMIIPVTFEKKEAIKTFIDRFLSIKKIKLSMAFENQNREFDSYFRHLTVPHQVWIDGNGKYLGATQGLKENILNDVIAGKIKNIGETNTKVIAFNPLNPFEIASLTKPLFYVEDATAFNTRYSEVMTGYVDGISSPLGFPPASPRIFGTNSSISSLYALAFGILTPERRPIASARRLIESKDKERLLWSTDIELARAWQDKNTYGYDLILKDFPKYSKDFPKSQKLRHDTIMSKIMLKTLEKKFGYKVRMEKREMECLIYKVIDTTLLKTTGEPSKVTIFPGYAGASIRNTKLSDIVYRLGYPLQGYIVIDETTGFNSPVDIELNVSLGNVKALNQEYAKYGISLTFGKRVVDMMVITD